MSFVEQLKRYVTISPTASEEVRYQYWRFRIFYSMYIGYIFYYVTRKSFVAAMPQLTTELGMDKIQLGTLSTVLYVSYGLSKFLSGVISDQSNPRYFMSFGLILTGIFNIFFGLSSSMLFFALFLAMNGLFQGWGWPPCARLLTYWYSQSERGRWWSVWNSSHNIGGALTPVFFSLAVGYAGWRGASHILGVICVGIGIFLINRLRDTPQSLGLPSIERFRNDFTATERGDEKDERLSTKELLFTYVLKNKYIWLLSFAYFFVYIIRTAINDWTMLYLTETKGFSSLAAAKGVFFFEIGGLFGALAAGWISDKIFGGMRGPVNLLFSVGVLSAIGFLWFSPSAGAFATYSSLALVGFFIFGPQMMIGIAAAEVSHKKAAGTATGFAGWIAYLGAASAGIPFGMITDEYGWTGFFSGLAICGVMAILFLLPVTAVRGAVRAPDVEN